MRKEENDQAVSWQWSEVVGKHGYHMGKTRDQSPLRAIE